MNDARNRTDGREMDRRLRRALSPERVSGARRQHYRQLMQEHEEREMRRVKRHSRFELGAVAAVLLLILSVSLWRFDLFGGEPDTSPQPGVGAAPVETAAPAATPTVVTAAGEGSACDVTPTSGQDKLFNDPMHDDWYLENDIWLSPMTIAAVNPSLPPGPSLWYTGGTPLVATWPLAAEQPLHISTRLIDEDTRPATETLEQMVPPGRFMDQFLVRFPEPGCWELTASTADQQLSIVIDVRPIEERPDMAQVLEMHELLPYAPPAECAVTSWRGPVDEGGRFQPYFWIDGEGISARSHTGIVWAYEATPFDFFLDEWGPIEVTGASVSSDTPLAFDVDHIHRVGFDGQFWLSWLIFPEPGCWEIEVTASEQRLEAVVWVYPPECRREAGEDIPALCEILD